MEHFLQGNFPLMHLLNGKTSVHNHILTETPINEVNDLSVRIFWIFWGKDFPEFWKNVMLPYQQILNVPVPDKNRFYSPEEHVTI